MYMYELFLDLPTIRRRTLNGILLSLSLSQFFEFNTRDERETSSSELSLPTSFRTKSSPLSESVLLVCPLLLVQVYLS